jgi:hypothetical protein
VIKQAWMAPLIYMVNENGTLLSRKNEEMVLFKSQDWRRITMSDVWLTSLITETPQEGFELAITLSRRGVKYTQPDVDVLKKLRHGYANSADGLTAASQVIAINFQTVAAANNYWRDKAK